MLHRAPGPRKTIGPIPAGLATTPAPNFVPSPVPTPTPSTKHTADLHRLLRIVTLIQSGPGWGPARLAAEFAVAERTIYRDIKKLQSTGIPVEHDRDADGYTIANAFFMQPTQLTVDEAVALAALAANLASSEQIGLLNPAAPAFAKILAQLPPHIRDTVNDELRHLTIHTGPSTPTEDHEDVYARLREAITRRRAVDCEYEPPGLARTTPALARPADDDGPRRFRLEPYALIFRVRAWYVVGQRDDRQGLRTLKLARFSRVQPTNSPYIIPDDFSIAAYLGNAWSMIRGTTHRVELRFDPRIADTIAETRWHATQEVEQHPDGSATFRCTVDGLDEIKYWVLSMGPSCRVVAPRELADLVRDLAQRTVALYT